MRGGRDVLVDHGIAAAATVVLVAHLLTDHMAQPVGGPGLPFGNIQAHGSLFDKEAASIALGTGFHALFAGPLLINLEEAFLKQFGFGEFEIIAGAFHRPDGGA